MQNQNQNQKSYYGVVNDSDGEYKGHYLVNNICPNNKVIKKTIKYGKGTMKYKNGDFYDGNWMDDKQSGKGIMKYANGNVYYGKWSNGYQYGRGIMRYANGDIYEGEWFGNMETGRDGITRYANGDIYSGELSFIQSSIDEDNTILRSIREGSNGYLRYDDGTSRNQRTSRGKKGKIVKVKRSPGNGTMYYANGDVYMGEWINNLRHGHGTMSYKNGDMYVGKWEKNLRHGYGTMSYKNNTFYEGQWINNKKSRKNITKKSKK